MSHSLCAAGQRHGCQTLSCSRWHCEWHRQLPNLAAPPHAIVLWAVGQTIIVIAQQYTMIRLINSMYARRVCHSQCSGAAQSFAPSVSVHEHSQWVWGTTAASCGSAMVTFLRLLLHRQMEAPMDLSHGGHSLCTAGQGHGALRSHTIVHDGRQ